MDINIQKNRQLTPQEKDVILNMWNSTYPAQIVYKGIDEFEKYLASRENAIHLLAKHNSSLVGWLCTFDRNDERWFALIVDPAFQKQGIGKMLMEQMQQMENTVNGWIVTHDKYIKSDGKPYLSPRPFYQKFGFTVTEEKLETEILSTIKIIWNKNKY